MLSPTLAFDFENNDKLKTIHFNTKYLFTPIVWHRFHKPGAGDGHVTS